jgi:hypothetical protein
MQEMELKTEQEIKNEQARHELEQQLNVIQQLVFEANAKDTLSQAEKKVAKVKELAREADLVAQEEDLERQRLSFEAALEAVRSEHAKERSEQERRLQQMEARLEALASANGEHSQLNFEC